MDLLKGAFATLKQVKKTHKPVSLSERALTRADITNNLSKLDIPDDAIVFIHSGFKSIGEVDGGPEAVVGALIDELVTRRNITVAMPAFSIETSMVNQLKRGKPFGARTMPTVFETIPAAFLATPGVVRSVHPTHSVSAIGPKAELLTSTHHDTDKSFGPSSPFGKIKDAEDYIMGLGSGLGTVTFYHTLEDYEPDFPRDVYTKEIFSVSCKASTGEAHHVTIPVHSPHVSEYRIDKRNSYWLRDIYAKLFEMAGVINNVTIGKANCWYGRADQIYNKAKHLAYQGLDIYSSPEDIATFIQKHLSSSNE